jgi:hypothetical protein
VSALEYALADKRFMTLRSVAEYQLRFLKMADSWIVTSRLKNKTATFREADEMSDP